VKKLMQDWLKILTRLTTRFLIFIRNGVIQFSQKQLIHLNLKTGLFFRKFIKNIFFMIILFSIAVIACNLWIDIQTHARLYSNVNEIPAKKVALLLGTVKWIRKGQINRYFKYRIEAAVALYQAGKIQHIIASGDNRTRFYNEPREMKKSLIEQGIPPQAITLDYAGFRTLDSVVRCKEIFSQDDIIIISQPFHNKRALFISDFYGIKAIGFNAKSVPFRIDMRTPLREYFARLKAVLDLYILRTQPKFLGEKVHLPV
jgi:SanA protein